MSVVPIVEARASGGALREAASSDRRRHDRRTLELAFRSTFSLPRGERGTGIATDFAAGGVRLRTDRPLDVGQWLRLDWSPTLSARNAMPDTLRPLDSVKARVVREIPVDPESDELPYAYGVLFAPVESNRCCRSSTARFPGSACSDPRDGHRRRGCGGTTSTISGTTRSSISTAS
jgi:hypothetical protein